MIGSHSLRRAPSGIAAAALPAVLLAAMILAVGQTPAQAATPTPWVTFYAHETATSTRETTYENNLAAAMKAQDLARTVTTARVLYDYAKREAAWLTTHPPQACYRAWWGYTRNYWTQVREGAGDILQGVLAYDAARVTAALVHLKKAQVYLAAMRTHLPTC